MAQVIARIVPLDVTHTVERSSLATGDLVRDSQNRKRAVLLQDGKVVLALPRTLTPTDSTLPKGRGKVEILGYVNLHSGFDFDFEAGVVTGKRKVVRKAKAQPKAAPAKPKAKRTTKAAAPTANARLDVIEAQVAAIAKALGV